ncbi:hypothetical protein H1R82_12390, partial [Thermoactinomyces intermedius]|nr:hypothetical protein [Thermoactinomyces intermedius]
MAKKRNKKKQSIGTKKEILFEIYGIVLLALSLVTIASYGAIGRNLTYLARFVVGTWDFLIPVLGMGLSVYVMAHHKWPDHWSSRWTGVVLVFMALITFNHYLTFHTIQTDKGIIDQTWYMLLEERNSAVPLDVGSGMLGAFSYALLHFLFDDTGTLIVLAAVVCCGFLLIADFSFTKAALISKAVYKKAKQRGKDFLIDWIRQYDRRQKRTSKQKRVREKNVPDVEVSKEPIDPVVYDFEDVAYQDREQPENGKKPVHEQMKLKLQPSEPQPQPKQPEP